MLNITRYNPFSTETCDPVTASIVPSLSQRILFIAVGILTLAGIAIALSRLESCRSLAARFQRSSAPVDEFESEFGKSYANSQLSIFNLYNDTILALYTTQNTPTTILNQNTLKNRLPAQEQDLRNIFNYNFRAGHRERRESTQNNLDLYIRFRLIWSLLNTPDIQTKDPQTITDFFTHDQPPVFWNRFSLVISFFSDANKPFRELSEDEVTHQLSQIRLICHDIVNGLPSIELPPPAVEIKDGLHRMIDDLRSHPAGQGQNQFFLNESRQHLNTLAHAAQNDDTQLRELLDILKLLCICDLADSRRFTPTQWEAPLSLQLDHSALISALGQPAFGTSFQERWTHCHETIKNALRPWTVTQRPFQV